MKNIKNVKHNKLIKTDNSSVSMSLWRKLLYGVIAATSALVFWFALWYIFALRIDKEVILPRPTDVLSRLYELMRELPFWVSCGKTILRIAAGTILGVISGVLLAGVMMLSRIARTLFSPLIAAVKATPVASFIIAALFWIGRGNVPTFISFLIVLPVVCDAVYTGFSNTDKNLLELAKVYNFSAFKKIRLLYLPSVVPYFLSSLRTSIGMAWKSGVAAEVLCTPPDSIGKSLYSTKVFMETTDMFAWTLVIIILSILFEKLAVLIIGAGLKKYGFLTEDNNDKDK